PDQPVTAMLGDLQLPLQEDRVLISIDGEKGLLPGHVLAQHHVVMDYVAATITLAPPGSRTPVGQAFPMPVSDPMRFPRTEITIAGETVGMLLDTGPAATILSQKVMKRWHEQHPDWAHYDGAHGLAEALQRAGGQVLETLVAEDAQWAGVGLDELTLAAQRTGVFERYMSRMMTAPVVGALGSNAFRSLRLELDYANETLYVSRP
ncbi:MAG: hypothetical protein AAGH65_11650, partial [Pseudomonadota bacterium]